MRGANMRVECDDSFFLLKPCKNLWNHFKTTHIFPYMQEKMRGLNHERLLDSSNCHVERSETSQSLDSVSNLGEAQDLGHNLWNLDSIKMHPKPCTHPDLVENLDSNQNAMDKLPYTEILKAWQDLKQDSKNDLNADLTQDSSIEINGYIEFLADFIMQTIRLDSIKKDLKLQESIYKYIESLDKQNLYIELIFVDSESMQELNKQYMAKDYPTDVLSFPLEIQDIESSDMPQCLGGIIINIYEVCDKAALYKHNPYAEFSLLFIHAFLHLLGFDHERDNGEQRAVEQAIIESLGLPDSLIVRVDSKNKFN
nr:rRNA maturation RNase YbeY [Helicobacter bilis]